jgi:LemA protein
MWWSLEWICLALLVFWDVGAYRRLARLRQQVVLQFTELNGHFVQLLAMLAEWHVQWIGQAGESGAQAHAQAAVHQTAQQVGAALIEARTRPLHMDALASLNQANEALDVAWQAMSKMTRNKGSRASQAALLPWQQRWAQQQVRNQLSVQHFNIAIDAYNTAIAQFPAKVVAWIFGFQPARGLQTLQVPSLVQGGAA